MLLIWWEKLWTRLKRVWESPFRWHQHHHNDSTCGLPSQTRFSLVPSALLVFKYPIKHLVQRWCGQSLLLWAGLRFSARHQNWLTGFWETSHHRIRLCFACFQTQVHVSYHHSTPLLQSYCGESWPELSFLRILILRYDRDVDADADANRRSRGA